MPKITALRVVARRAPTIENGKVPARVNGGGIYNLGPLDIKNSTITQNTALINGGGIFNGGTLTLKSTDVTGNTPDDIFP